MWHLPVLINRGVLSWDMNILGMELEWCASIKVFNERRPILSLFKVNTRVALGVLSPEHKPSIMTLKHKSLSAWRILGSHSPLSIIHKVARGSGRYVGILVHLGCYNKMPQTGWFLNNRNLSLTVFKTGKPKITAAAGSVSGEGWLLVSRR